MKKGIKYILSLIIIIGFMSFMFLYNKDTEEFITLILLSIAGWQIGTWLGNWIDGETK